MTTKRCTRCDTDKPLTQFGRYEKSKDGMKNYCKECVSEVNAGRYAANRERHKARVREWQEANPDKVLEYKREYTRRKRTTGD